MLSVIAPLSAVGDDLWDITDSLLKKISGTRKDLVEATEKFKDLGNRLNSVPTIFESLDKNRKELVGCLETSFNNYLFKISDCAKTKQEIIKEADLAKRQLISQIDDVRTAAERQITSLNREIENVGSEINELKGSLATINDMSEENVLKIVSELELIRAQYRGMVAERTTFVANLDVAIARILAHSYLNNEDIESLRKSVCSYLNS